MNERIMLQARYASELVYKLKGQGPEVGSVVFRPIVDQPPEFWEPLTVKEVKVVSGSLEVVVTNHNGDIEILRGHGEPYQWIDMPLMQRIWSNITLFEVQWPKGSETFVKDSSTTMNYVPKCQVAVKTGLCYNTVISEITDASGNHRYTSCPYEIEQKHECSYPDCLEVLISTPQVSITGAKAAYRASCAVALFGKTRNQFLYLTNGNHHLNLVSIMEAIRGAWFSGYLKNLQGKLDMLYGDETWEHRDMLVEKLAILEGNEMSRWQEAEAMYPARTQIEDAIDEERMHITDNIVLKQKKEE